MKMYNNNNNNNINARIAPSANKNDNNDIWVHGLLINMALAISERWVGACSVVVSLHVGGDARKAATTFADHLLEAYRSLNISVAFALPCELSVNQSTETSFHLNCAVS